MAWQDLVFGTGSVVFIMALIPTLLSKTDKPRWETAAITSVVLFAFFVGYYSLEFWYSSATAFITATIWLSIAFQGAKIQKGKDWYE